MHKHLIHGTQEDKCGYWAFKLTRIRYSDIQGLVLGGGWGTLGRAETVIGAGGSQWAFYNKQEFDTKDLHPQFHQLLPHPKPRPLHLHPRQVCPIITKHHQKVLMIVNIVTDANNPSGRIL